MDMKELHMIRTDAGNIIVTTSLLSKESSSGVIMKLFDDIYICNLHNNDDFCIIANSVEGALKMIKVSYENKMKHWLISELLNTGISLSK